MCLAARLVPTGIGTKQPVQKNRRSNGHLVDPQRCAARYGGVGARIDVSSTPSSASPHSPRPPVPLLALTLGTYGEGLVSESAYPERFLPLHQACLGTIITSRAMAGMSRCATLYISRHSSLGADPPSHDLPTTPHTRDTLCICIPCPHSHSPNLPLPQAAPTRWAWKRMRVLGGMCSHA